ncbi:MAG TPA: S26 family signal peptidase [Candidatus Saccharimonadales bacterium]|nr:S26 family signal peptidase [Candidatus Saccharimonadales bacterium]
MLLALRPDQLVLVSGIVGRLKPGHIIVFRHNGLEKIKRITAVDKQKGYFVEGDNRRQSVDSRHFGWIAPHAVAGRVIWPRV